MRSSKKIEYKEYISELECFYESQKYSRTVHMDLNTSTYFYLIVEAFVNYYSYEFYRTRANEEIEIKEHSFECILLKDISH